jgi:hypothetical protein
MTLIQNNDENNYENNVEENKLPYLSFELLEYIYFKIDNFQTRRNFRIAFEKYFPQYFIETARDKLQYYMEIQYAAVFSRMFRNNEGMIVQFKSKSPFAIIVYPQNTNIIMSPAPHQKCHEDFYPYIHASSYMNLVGDRYLLCCGFEQY